MREWLPLLCNGLALRAGLHSWPYVFGRPESRSPGHLLARASPPLKPFTTRPPFAQALVALAALSESLDFVADMMQRLAPTAAAPPPRGAGSASHSAGARHASTGGGSPVRSRLGARSGGGGGSGDSLFDTLAVTADRWGDVCSAVSKDALGRQHSTLHPATCTTKASTLQRQTPANAFTM